MQRAFAFALAAAAAVVVAAALVLPIAAEEPDGAELYSKDCSQCHGMDGAADTPAGKALHAMALNDPKFADIEAAQVIQFIRELPKHKAVSAKVSDAELTAITAHIHQLAGAKAD